jgi:signal transduction histidine kinase
MTTERSSDVRIMRVVTFTQWTALIVGIVSGVVISGGTPESFLAATTGGLYVLGSSAIPLAVLRRPLVLEAYALGGSLLTMASVAATGGASSPYVLLSVVPAVAATVLGGFRVGLTTGTLSASLLVAITLSAGNNLIPAIGTALLYLLVVLTVGQIRRMLLDIETRAEALEHTSEEATRRAGELTTANELLTRLAAVASNNDGPIAVGRTALESITATIPGASGVAMLTTSNGPLVISQTGDGQNRPIRTRLPLVVNDREVGVILLATDEILTEQQRHGVEAVIQPVALSFSNLLLLQEIAGKAVKEERSRLARDLHDEIGPTLASLGLALDMAAMQAGEPDMATHLDELRGSVTDLVEDVRATVADLRTDRHGSLVTRINEGTHSLAPPPTIDVTVDERRPPRPSIIDDIASVVVEAVRNAYHHSGSDRIRVHGWADFERGRVVVEDRGSGFDATEEHAGHFGLVGMNERATRVGGTLTVVSNSRGTTVALKWGDE